MKCRNCDGPLYRGGDPYQIDSLVCRACQKSPAVQIRVMLQWARGEGYDFDRAWTYALGEQVERVSEDGEVLIDFIGSKVRWPHDTAHRIEWKNVIGSRKARIVWQQCFDREPPKPKERTLASLALAA